MLNICKKLCVSKNVVKKTLLVAVVSSLAITSFAKSYFVAPNGKDSSNGKSAKHPWKTISYAASEKSPVKAGDKVYIKAGLYHENVVFEKGGKKGKPIVFEGYTRKPGDKPKMGFKLGKSLNKKLMPLLDGKNRGEGIALKVVDGRGYIEMRNFQITNYRQGISIWGNGIHDIVVENILLTKLGKLDGSYSGQGIIITHGAKISVKNCIVVNAQAEAISLIANDSLLENCKVYSNEVLKDKGAEGTDYYIHISGNNNIIRKCYIERIIPKGLGNFPHVGHGIGFKEKAENNLVEDCTAVNIAGGGFYVRWSGVRNNKFINCVALGPKNEKANDSCGFLLREGAENNIFEKCKTDRCRAAVRFLHGGEERGNYTAYKNIFKNCQFLNSDIVIDFSRYSSGMTYPVEENTFMKCVIKKANFLFRSCRENKNNKLVNCKIKGVKKLKDPSSTHKIGMKFKGTRISKAWKKKL